MTAATLTHAPFVNRRLIYSLLLAAALHLALIFGVGFNLSPPVKTHKSLEITLATFNHEKPPREADFLAQQNQQGGALANEKVLAPSKQQPPARSAQPRRTSPPAEPVQQLERAAASKTLTTQGPSKQQIRVPPRREDAKADKAPAKPPVLDRAWLSAEISNLETQLANEAESQAKRPRKYTISAATTMRDKGAWYKEDWRRKIERVGNLNYPAEARSKGIYGSLRLLVTINADGSLRHIQVLESSGQPVLDQAAQRIVKLAAPFSPLTGDLSDVDQLEIIRTWRFERGNRLFSN